MQSTEELSCPGFESVRGARPPGGHSSGGGRRAGWVMQCAGGAHLPSGARALTLEGLTVHGSSGGGGLYTSKRREEGGGQQAVSSR